jgi:hypothetical protein
VRVTIEPFTEPYLVKQVEAVLRMAAARGDIGGGTLIEELLDAVRAEADRHQAELDRQMREYNEQLRERYK